ncbi:MAG: hypothetical protein RL757_952, partial [Bacteroidota bacterium]
QRMLYDRFAPKMLGVLRRYLNHSADAEDVLLEAFFKVFTNIEKYESLGSFEGWIRRIVVNEALMFLRKNRLLTVEANENYHNIAEDRPFTVESQMTVQEILKLVEQLPLGYRTVFNLYVLEGFKHQEIADMLGISINTSKSQLILAKEKLRNMMKKN